MTDIACRKFSVIQNRSSLCFVFVVAKHIITLNEDFILSNADGTTAEGLPQLFACCIEIFHCYNQDVSVSPYPLKTLNPISRKNRTVASPIGAPPVINV